MTPKVKASKATSDAEQARIDDRFPELADLAFLLDSRWRVPGTNFRFGVDAVAGLLPVVGDAASALVSLHILMKAHRLGASGGLLTLMAGNVALDTIIGSIPVAGSIVDLFYKANNVNVRLLRRHLERQGRRLPAPLPGQEPAAGAVDRSSNNR